MKCYDWAIYRQREMPVELISNPYPTDKCELSVMVRVVPGDPATMIEVDVKDLTLIDKENHFGWINRVPSESDPTVYHVGQKD